MRGLRERAFFFCAVEMLRLAEPLCSAGARGNSDAGLCCVVLSLFWDEITGDGFGVRSSSLEG